MKCLHGRLLGTESAESDLLRARTRGIKDQTKVVLRRVITFVYR